MNVLSPSPWCTWSGSTGIAIPITRKAMKTAPMIGSSALIPILGCALNGPALCSLAFPVIVDTSRFKTELPAHVRIGVALRLRSLERRD